MASLLLLLLVVPCIAGQETKTTSFSRIDPKFLSFGKKISCSSATIKTSYAGDDFDCTFLCSLDDACRAVLFDSVNKACTLLSTSCEANTRELSLQLMVKQSKSPGDLTYRYGGHTYLVTNKKEKYEDGRATCVSKHDQWP